MISARMTVEQRALMARFKMDPGEVRPGVTRQRCRRCRGFLWGQGKKTFAVDGLYCTVVCAQWSDEENKLWDEWWQRVDIHCGCHGSTGRKIMYETEQEAVERIRIPYNLRPYECPAKPGFFHLTSRVEKDA